MSTRVLHRRAFALNGMVLLLCAAIALVLVWRAYLMWTNLPLDSSIPHSRKAYMSGYKAAIVLTPVLGPLLFMGLAWGIGGLVSRLTGRSEGLGNAAAVVFMSLVLAFTGYGAIRMSTAPGKSSASQASSLPRHEPHAADARATPSLPSIGDSARATPAVPSPPRVPAHPPERRVDVAPVTDALAAELNAQVDRLVVLASRVLPELARTPPHSIPKLQTRTTETEALKADAQSLKAALDRASDDAASRLISAGLDPAKARHEAFRWANMDFGLATRGFGADALIRLCDASTQECAMLSDKIGAWNVNAKGELTASDPTFRHEAQSKRFFVKADADRLDWIVRQLRAQ